ncbi:MAG: MFS transporter [Acidobacteria bacterium]|nr:MFS transporter [Acidobacteriota bacterium]
MITGAATVGERARRRVTRRVMPYLFLLYVVAYLDRVNVGYATLEMTSDLGFSPEVYGFGAGVFFVGYFLLEIPGTILVERWSARRWIARIMVSWGVLAALTGFVGTATQFYWARFLLGVAEAGFFPGMVVYLGHWFRSEDRARAFALFVAAQPIANIVGSPVSGLLLGVHWLGLAGWRWLFILEGLPAVVLGVVTLFYLTDRPQQAAWLPKDERDWLVSQLERERLAKQGAHTQRVLDALRHPHVLLLTFTYFLIVTSVYGVNFWLPTIIKKLSGSSNLVVTSVSALPYCVGLVAVLLFGWSSDRTKERRRHTAVAMAVAGVGLLLVAAARENTALAVAMFGVAAVGLYGYQPGFWSLPTSFLTGTAAAAAVGLINSTGNLGGFVGPFVVGYLGRKTGSLFAGVLYLSLSALAAAALVLCLRVCASGAIEKRPV